MKAEGKAKVGRRDFLRVAGCGRGRRCCQPGRWQRAPGPTAKPTTRRGRRAIGKPST